MIIARLWLFLVFISHVVPAQAEAPNLGYTDTPILPGTKWRVHDGSRPAPNLVTPGHKFSEYAKAPEDALILFDGKNLSNWRDESGKKANWAISGDFMEVTRSGSIETKQHFQDFQLHLEFASPEKVLGNSQGRGNSGVIIFGKFEIQILDSYDNPTYPDGQTGALYGQLPPLVNASRQPGKWQTYDIIFEAPRVNSKGELVKKANVTLLHNGILLHHRQEFIGTVQHRGVGTYQPPIPTKGPIKLQDHGNPVRFRNIWIRPLDSYDK